MGAFSLIVVINLLNRKNANMSNDGEIESKVSSDSCGTLTSFKLELNKNRAKYRRIEEDLLSDGEKEKLNQRRERNKAAAARCRNRRRETISRLEKEASNWDEKVQELKSDIEKLTKQRDQLEFLLQVHNATCSLINDPLPSQIQLDDLLNGNGSNNKKGGSKTKSEKGSSALTSSSLNES